VNEFAQSADSDRFAIAKDEVYGMVWQRFLPVSSTTKKGTPIIREQQPAVSLFAIGLMGLCTPQATRRVRLTLSNWPASTSSTAKFAVPNSRADYLTVGNTVMRSFAAP
jgi:hypothetical protein